MIDIKVGSVTNAQRGARVLRANGYRVNIRKLEHPSKSDGCGYVLRISGDAGEAAELLKNSGIKVKGVDYL